MRRLVVLALLASACTAAPASAVIGGGPATEEYPWMASVQYDGSHSCGGTLVRPGWVLTAAHCVVGEEPGDFRVVLGTHTLSSGEGTAHEVEELLVHPAYEDDPNGGHDVALMRLATPSGQALMRLATPADAALWAAGTPVRVIGWGAAIFLVGPGSDDLQEVDTQVVSDADCDLSYNTLSPFAYDPDTMLCAGERTGLRDSCQGDSGGPLVTRDAAGAWVQVGATSFGLGCGFPIYYGVYARLGAPALHDWLTATLPPLP